jgi:transmembrane sensor
MTTAPTTPTSLQLLEIRAQAAVWVTDLHGPDRNAALEAGVRRWLAEDPRHAQAFEHATEAWQQSGNLLARPPLPNNSRFARPGATPPSVIRARITRYSLAGAVALSLALTGAFAILKNPAISTGLSEQKTVALADGTQLTLNANSRVIVDYDEQVRKITLTRGEAYFNVTKHPTRPFVVVIGTRKVIALGTGFEVRREDPGSDNFSVTLIEGRVAVEPLSAPDPILPQPIQPATLPRALTLLDPGQRLSIAAHQPDALDSPPLEKVTAWQRGQLIFEDTSLREAAAEFNRYGKRRLIIDAAVPDDHHVGGVFRIGDPVSFAHAMAQAYRLRLIERDQEIILTTP